MTPLELVECARWCGLSDYYRDAIQRAADPKNANGERDELIAYTGIRGVVKYANRFLDHIAALHAALLEIQLVLSDEQENRREFPHPPTRREHEIGVLVDAALHASAPPRVKQMPEDKDLTRNGQPVSHPTDPATAPTHGATSTGSTEQEEESL